MHVMSQVGKELASQTVARQNYINMYCPVHGCTSDSKNNLDGTLHFFSFPNAEKGPDEKKRRYIWIEFCKRKGFVPTKNTRIGSKHFESNAFMPSCSPEFFNSINFPGRRKVLLKDDTVPTTNKVAFGTREQSRTVKNQPTGAIARKKVRVISTL